MGGGGGGCKFKVGICLKGVYISFFRIYVMSLNGSYSSDFT